MHELKIQALSILCQCMSIIHRNTKIQNTGITYKLFFFLVLATLSQPAGIGLMLAHRPRHRPNISPTPAQWEMENVRSQRPQIKDISAILVSGHVHIVWT